MKNYWLNKFNITDFESVNNDDVFTVSKAGSLVTVQIHHGLNESLDLSSTGRINFERLLEDGLNIRKHLISKTNCELTNKEFDYLLMYLKKKHERSFSNRETEVHEELADSRC